MCCCKFSSNTIFRWHTFGTFCIVKFYYFSGISNKVKERFFKYSWLNTVLVILEMKISLVSTKNILVLVILTEYEVGQFTQGVLYRQFLVSYNLCTIYLHVIEVCLKVTIAVFYFCHSKNSLNVMNNTLNPISIYSWKKIFLLRNIRNKCVIRKINLNFWRYEEWTHFSFKSLLFPIWSRIPF